jgi:hypothetical protein
LAEPAPAAPDAAAPAGRLPRAFWVAAAAAILMVIGGAGPWATALDIVTVNGTSGDGWIVIFAALIAGVMLFVWSGRRRAVWPLVVAAVLGALSALVAIVDLASIEDLVEEEFGGTEVVDAAWGIYVALIASLALAIAALITAATRPRA